MITRTVTERIGEWLGPVDWAYDFTKHKSVNPSMVEAGKAALRTIEETPDGWLYIPSFLSSFRVVRVGMYDGWPFWESTPAIGYIGPLDSIEVAFFYDLHADKFRRAKEPA